MNNLTETAQQDTGPELTQAPSHDEVLALEADKLAAERAREREEDLRYRYCDDPFCACTADKMRFLKLVGVLDGWGDLSRDGRDSRTCGTPILPRPPERRDRDDRLDGL